jgi:hypothetical protein
MKTYKSNRLIGVSPAFSRHGAGTKKMPRYNHTALGMKMTLNIL